VLIFRLISFWLVTLVGWGIYSRLSRARRRSGNRTETSVGNGKVCPQRSN
jgi:hypothetical protein